MPLDNVVGIQLKIARPMASPAGTNAMDKHNGAATAVNPRIVAMPNRNALGDLTAQFITTIICQLVT